MIPTVKRKNHVSGDPAQCVAGGVVTTWPLLLSKLGSSVLAQP